MIFDNSVEILPSRTPLSNPDWDNSSLDGSQQSELMNFLNSFRNLFRGDVTYRVTSHSTNTGDALFVKGRPYRYDHAR